MGIVALEGIEFFAHHGYYDEEQKTGNRYTIDLQVHTDLDQSGDSDLLEHTVNYEKLYLIVQEVMMNPVRLLERAAVKIAKDIIKEFPFIEKVDVSVIKHNPPVGGVCRQSRVSISLHPGSK